MKLFFFKAILLRDYLLTYLTTYSTHLASRDGEVN